MIRKYLPSIGWRRLTRQEVLALHLDRFKKHEGLFVNFPSGKSWRLYVRKVSSPTPPSNPPLAPA